MKCLLCLLFFALQGWADVPEMKSAVKETKNEIIASEENERVILGTLYSINARMKDMSKKRDRMTDRIMASQGDIKKLALNIEALEDKVNRQRLGLREGVKGLYQFRGSSILRTLFSSQSGHQLGRSLKYLKRVSDRGYSLIKEYEKSLKTLKTERRQLDFEVQRLAKMQTVFKNQELALATEQMSKGALLARLKTQQSSQFQKLSELRKSNPASEVNLGFFEKKGELNTPLVAKAVKTFGYIQDETYRFRLAHKGMFYPANSQTKVSGIFGGTVAFAGELPGYGLTTIVDHGDHYYTVYGYMTKAEVKVGEIIKEGQTIGLAGGKSPWYGDGLYFEIRHFSDPIDPQHWFKQL